MWRTALADLWFEAGKNCVVSSNLLVGWSTSAKPAVDGGKCTEDKATWKWERAGAKAVLDPLSKYVVDW